jgi:hypothetical protein
LLKTSRLERDLSEREPHHAADRHSPSKDVVTPRKRQRPRRPGAATQRYAVDSEHRLSAVDLEDVCLVQEWKTPSLSAREAKVESTPSATSPIGFAFVSTSERVSPPHHPS